MSAAHKEKVDLDLETMTVSLHTVKTSFRHVTFHNVAEAYTIGVDLNLKYTIGPEMQPSSSDWIGLYQVGWRSTKNYVCYEWSLLPSNHIAGSQLQSHVIFSADKLPRDDGEFYQFCYITSKGQVFGLSTPFQFRKPLSSSPSLDDLIEIEDENGEMLVIKSKTAYLDDQLTRANDKIALLNQDIQLLESEKEILVLKKQDSEKRLSCLTEENGLQQNQILKVSEQLALVSCEVTCMKATISQLLQANNRVTKEKDELLRQLTEKNSCVDELQQVKKSLQNEKDALVGQIKSLEDEKVLYQSHFNSTEHTHLQRIEELQSELMASKTLLQQQVDLENELTQLTAQVQQLTVERDNNMSTIKILEDRVCEAEKQWSEGEKYKWELNEKLLFVSSDLKLSKAEVDSMKDEMENIRLAQLKEREDLLVQVEDAVNAANEERKEKEAAREELAEMRIKLEETVELAGVDCALYALNAAHSALKDRYFKLEKKVIQQQAVLEHSTGRVNELEVEVTTGQREIKQFKDRLQMGLEQYKNKVVECLKLQETCQQLKKSGITTGQKCLADDESYIISEQHLQQQKTLSEPKRDDTMQDKIEQYGSHETLSHWDVLHVVPQTSVSTQFKPVVQLPPRLKPEKLYPEIVQDLTDECGSTGGIQLNLSNVTATWSTDDVAMADSSAGLSLNDVLPKCPVCSFEFPTLVSSSFVASHIDMHYVGEVCPLCNQKFPPNSQQYEVHVQSHFSVE